MSGIPLEFQPWLQPSHIPDSLWNYQAPTLNEWEIDRNWDWAEKDASEYLTDEQKAAKDEAAVVERGGEYRQEDLDFARRAAEIESMSQADFNAQIDAMMDDAGYETSEDDDYD